MVSGIGYDSGRTEFPLLIDLILSLNSVPFSDSETTKLYDLSSPSSQRISISQMDLIAPISSSKYAPTLSSDHSVPSSLSNANSAFTPSSSSLLVLSKLLLDTLLISIGSLHSVLRLIVLLFVLGVSVTVLESSWEDT